MAVCMTAIGRITNALALENKRGATVMNILEGGLMTNGRFTVFTRGLTTILTKESGLMASSMVRAN